MITLWSSTFFNHLSSDDVEQLSLTMMKISDVFMKEVVHDVAEKMQKADIIINEMRDEIDSITNIRNNTNIEGLMF